MSQKSIICGLTLLLWTAFCPAARADESATELDLGTVGRWPDLALGNDGTLHLVYVGCPPNDAPPGCAVRYRRYDPVAALWSDEETVPGSEQVSLRPWNRPRIAVDSGGRVHVAFGRDIHTDPPLWYIRRDGAGWGERLTVSAQPIEFLDIEVLGAEVFIATNEIEPSATRIYRRQVDGSGAFSAVELGSGDGGKDVQLQRSQLGDELYVTWWWACCPFRGIRLWRLLSAADSWSEVEQLPVLDHHSPAYPQPLVTAGGRISLTYSAWAQVGPGQWEPEGVWLFDEVTGDESLTAAPVLLSSTPIGEEDDSNPTAAADGSGSRFVVWRGEDSLLHYTNNLWWRGHWIADSVFPTTTAVAYPTVAMGDLWTHLVWQDPASKHLRHNPRLQRRDDAAVAGHTIVSYLSPGQSVDVTITMTNTGTLPWFAGGAWQLGAVDDNDPLSAELRVAVTQPVEPGQDFDAALTLTAPATEGSYTTDWQMVFETPAGGYWFGEVLAVSVDVSWDPPGDGGGGAGGEAPAAGDDGLPAPPPGEAAGGCGCRNAGPAVTPQLHWLWIALALLAAGHNDRRSARRRRGATARRLGASGHGD